MKQGYSPQLAGNPNFQYAYGMAGGNKDQAAFNYRAMQFLGMGTGAPFESLEGTGTPASMSPTAGLKAVLPGAKAKGGKVSKRKR